MPLIESQQVRIRLVKEDYRDPDSPDVTGKQILDQLKKNRQMKNDGDGPYVGVQFDGHEFRFRPGKFIEVSTTVGRCLQRSAGIIVGPDKLTGPMVCYLEIYDSFEMGLESDAEPKPATACPICGEDQVSFPRLQRHLIKEKRLHPDLFKDDEPDPYDEPVK